MTKKACSPLTLRPVAASLATLLAVPLVTPTLAHAQGVELNTLKIEERSLDTNPYAEPGAPYKAKKSGDERYKRDLAETPKTISVLTKTQIEDSGYTDLRAILDAQPGITLGTGENGNAFGDRYIIRGQEARSDVFVDGIRDPGMTIRESFATEQVEITKGPDSSFGGRGTSGGAVNSVTKRANTVYDFSQVDVGLGMDKYRRLTLDTNQVLSDTTAVRINALHSYLENPDRSPTDAKRNGLALSGRFEISKDLEIDLDYYALRAKDLPDLGLFYAGASGARTIAWDAPVYAQTEDFLESEIDTITGKVRLQLGDSRYLTNVTRFGTTDNGYLMTGTRQTTVQAFNGVDVDDYNGTYLSTHQGWQEVEYLANSTQLHWPAQLGGQKHDFIFGLEYSDHKVKNGVYSATAQGTSNCEYAGRGGAASSGFCITSPTGYLQNTSGLLNRTVTKGSWDSDWQAKTVSLSAMDTVSLNDKWTVFTGLRYDQSTIKLLTQNATTQAVTGDYTSKDNLWNIHAGLSYAFTPNAITYFSYATASDLNGGESDVGTSSGYGGLIVSDGQAASADPERSESLEVGAKWNLMDKKLLASLAAFQVTKSDVMEGNGYDSAGTYNSGENRVRGLEFGLSGNITPSLSAHAGLTVMKSKVLESATASNVGKRLGNFADQSAAVTLKYKLSPSLSLGGSAKYESDRYVGQPDTAAGDYKLPSYTVVDVFATYKWDRQTTVRLNVANLADKDYLLAGYRSGDFLYKGEGRNAKVTVSYDF